MASRIDVPDTTAYDFLCSVIRLHNNADFTPKNKPNADIQEWVNQHAASRPAEICELSDRFFNMETSFGLTITDLVKLSDGRNAQDFLEFLEALSPYELLIRFLYSGIGPGADVTVEFLQQIEHDQARAFDFVQKQLTFSPQEKWRVMEYLLKPAETLAKFVYLLRWHYEHIYRHDEVRVRELLMSANQELRARLHDEEYLRLMVPYDRKRPPSRVTLALSYYYEKASAFNVMENIFVFGYRYHEVIESQHSVLVATQLFKALGDETRMTILKLLVKRPWYGHELAERLNISNSTVSHHIATLALCGVVKTYRKENRIYFELDSEEVQGLVAKVLDRVLLG